MHELQQKALRNALATLDAMGCRYRVVLSDGTERVTLAPDPTMDLPTTPLRKREHDVKFGGLKSAARKLIMDMKPGEIRQVSIDDFEHRVPFNVFAASISNAGISEFGIGAFGVSSDKEIALADRKILTVHRSR